MTKNLLGLLMCLLGGCGSSVEYIDPKTCNCTEITLPNGTVTTNCVCKMP